MLGLHYIRTGKISREIGNNFMILFERRHSCDYDNFIDSTKEDVEELIPLVLKLLTIFWKKYHKDNGNKFIHISIAFSCQLMP